MTALPAADLELPVDAISIVRLHGVACFECGSSQPPLAPAGHLYTKTAEGRQGWAVVACEKHADGPS